MDHDNNDEQLKPEAFKAMSEKLKAANAKIAELESTNSNSDIIKLAKQIETLTAQVQNNNRNIGSSSYNDALAELHQRGITNEEIQAWQKENGPTYGIDFESMPNSPKKASLTIDLLKTYAQKVSTQQSSQPQVEESTTVVGVKTAVPSTVSATSLQNSHQGKTVTETNIEKIKEDWKKDYQ